VFEKKLPLKETMDQVLNVFAELLVEIDTVSVILIDPNATKIVLFSHKSRRSEARPAPGFSPQVLYQVMKKKDGDDFQF